ncbi:primosomal protein N' [Isachenkonia alkalipeptolytica]|uniref:Replication restart protein PriA n=1 Tax=Isachenkonia alkalipeptolytica TaxID=2565777 RepID=A0AA43XMP7_9CLOT|nr:primosomal protein N' [Isachenkonia alkalipeptolytica]NBG89134.1 primosomal protein N' [Isachenkonia alkalipeptolytica]
MEVAKVIIDQNSHHTDRPFDYKIPGELREAVKVGSRVQVTFGKGHKKMEGYVLGVKDIEKPRYTIKNLQGVVQNVPPLSELQIDMILWMKKTYLCTYMEAISAVAPPKAYGNIKEKKDVYVRRKISSEKLESQLEKTPNNAKRQREILQYFLEEEELLLKSLPGIKSLYKNAVNALEKKGILEVIEKEKASKLLSMKSPSNPPRVPLTTEQKKALETMKEGFQQTQQNGVKGKTYLLHGVTGSGKTELYLGLIEKALEMGKTAIVLVPEISLTPQTMERFTARFGEAIALIHSSLTLKERYHEWEKIQQGKAKIVIGARSAIFANLENLGMIVVDEEHEYTYKSEQNPKYHAIEIAKYRSEKEGAQVILGSATPSVESYYRGEKGIYELISLDRRVTKHQLPQVEMVDMREELDVGNLSMISGSLKSQIEENLKNRGQTILFLNRRGFSTFLSCKKCGYVEKCQDCDITMTYHLPSDELICHYCGKKKKPITECPDCGSTTIKHFGYGTQKLEKNIENLFPQARILRMDVDTTTEKGAHEKVLNAFKNREADILIGTQMISKGLDFPGVTLVGIIAADSILNLPDFRASERTFQLLTQVAGRAGRGEDLGSVVLQTYKPEHYSIEEAIKQDYVGFYKREIGLREAFEYPPFTALYLVNLMGEDEDKVYNTAIKISKGIRYILKNEGHSDCLEECILGPNPSVITKINKNYRYRILLKNINIDKQLLKKVLKYVCINKRKQFVPDEVNLSIDFNPYSII